MRTGQCAVASRQRTDSAAGPRNLHFQCADQAHRWLTGAQEMQGTGEESQWENEEVTVLLRCFEETPAISLT